MNGDEEAITRMLSEALQTPAEAPRVASIPPAPPREERRPFSTRVRPSLQAELKGYVTELRAAGWPVTGEMVLEALLLRLRDDAEFRASLTGELARE